MTTNRATGPVLSVADTPTGLASGSPVGADLPPDPSRDYFPNAAPIDFVLLDVHLLVGPLTPTPNLTLAEVVQRIAS